MTPADLMAISPARMEAMTDEELGRLLEPLLPIARAEFLGRGDKAVTLPSGTRTTARSIQNTVNTLQNILRLQTEEVTKPTTVNRQNQPKVID